MKVIAKIFNYLFYGAIIVIAFLLLASKYDLPGNVDFLIVRSGSMRPAIDTGSLVVVKPEPDYGPGDIITFRVEQGKTVTHRVVEKTGENGQTLFITKGDANQNADSDRARLSQVQGRVWFSLPRAGYLVDTARTPWGFALVIVLPALLVIGDELRKIWLELKKMRRRRSNNIIKPKKA